MSVVGGTPSAGLVSRIQNILMKPAAEWDAIAVEPATTQGLFTGYACLLAVLPLIGTLVGRVLIGTVFGGGMGMVAALIGGIVLGILGYVLNLALVFVMGLVINALAPSFNAKSDSIQALKVSVYAGTALWVAGAVSWFPVVGWLIGLAALGYTCYLLYLGVGKVMQPPADKTMVYTLVIIGAQILLYLVVGFVVTMVSAMVLLSTGAAMVPHY
jgi:hypothetical protein